MNRNERKQFIINQLKSRSTISVAELKDTFQISEVSVRKLLTQLEKEGAIKRIWGGAVSAHGSFQELSHTEKILCNHQEKQAIAKAAYQYIADGDAIFLDSGTTTLQLARLIVANPPDDIMIGTDSIHIAMELSAVPGLNVVVIGGELRANIYSCVGNIAEENLRRLRFDKGFITGNHFSLENGYSSPIISESSLKRTAIEVSKESFVLMDYSKYGEDSFAIFANHREIDFLISDWKLPMNLKMELEKYGVKVIIAE